MQAALAATLDAGSGDGSGSPFGVGVGVPQPMARAKISRLMPAPYPSPRLVASQHPHEGRQRAGAASRGFAHEQADAAAVEALDAPELQTVPLTAHQVGARRELDQLGPSLIGVGQTRERRIVAYRRGGEKPLAVHAPRRSHGPCTWEILNRWVGLNARGKVVPMGAVPQAVKLALMGLVVMVAGCDTASIETQVAQDAVAQFEIAKRSGDGMQTCVHAGLVSAAFLQAKDETSYRKWLAIEKQECAAAGVAE